MILLIGTQGNNQDKGFTFIELLIVTIIISVLVATAIPRFRASYEHLLLNVNAGNIESFLNASRELAVLEETVLKIVINHEARSLSLLQETIIEQETQFQPYAYPVGKSLILPEGSSIHSNPNELLFYTDGSSEEATIKLKNRLEEEISIHINFSGKITRHTEGQ